MNKDEQEDLVTEFNRLMDNIKTMTPDNAADRWQGFLSELRDWNNEAHKYLNEQEEQT